MLDYDAFPRLIRRECGGWLALAALESDLKIGVVAESEDAARAKFIKAAAEWRAIIAEFSPKPF